MGFPEYQSSQSPSADVYCLIWTETILLPLKFEKERARKIVRQRKEERKLRAAGRRQKEGKPILRPSQWKEECLSRLEGLGRCYCTISRTIQVKLAIGLPSAVNYRPWAALPLMFLVVGFVRLKWQTLYTAAPSTVSVCECFCILKRKQSSLVPVVFADRLTPSVV